MNLSTSSIRVDGIDRLFLLGEPARSPSMIIFSLHGTRSSPADQARFSRFAQFADDHGAVVVFPQAVMPFGRGYEWDHDADMPFLRRLVADMLGRYPMPNSRVSLSGMSGGARMACHFAAAHPEQVDMVGAVAGLRAPDAGALSQPVPILAFHGTTDRINPYNGSGTSRWNESVPDAAKSWAAANGLAPDPVRSVRSATLTCDTYGGAGQPGRVVLWTCRDAGHTWPGTRLGPFVRILLGRTTTEIDATAEIYSFAHQL